MAATPTGRGYWLVAADDGVFAFGDAQFFGSASQLELAAPVVGIAATARGDGYTWPDSDGGVFSFGRAAFEGSASRTPLDFPIAGIEIFGYPPTQGPGAVYGLIQSDGNVLIYGPGFLR